MGEYTLTFTTQFKVDRCGQVMAALLTRSQINVKVRGGVVGRCIVTSSMGWLMLYSVLLIIGVVRS